MFYFSGPESPAKEDTNHSPVKCENAGDDVLECVKVDEDFEIPAESTAPKVEEEKELGTGSDPEKSAESDKSVVDSSDVTNEKTESTDIKPEEVKAPVEDEKVDDRGPRPSTPDDVSEKAEPAETIPDLPAVVPTCTETTTAESDDITEVIDENEPTNDDTSTEVNPSSISSDKMIELEQRIQGMSLEESEVQETVEEKTSSEETESDNTTTHLETVVQTTDVDNGDNEAPVIQK